MKRPKMSDMVIPKGHDRYEEDYQWTWQELYEDLMSIDVDVKEKLTGFYEEVELEPENNIRMPQKLIDIVMSETSEEEEQYFNRLGYE